MKCHGFCLTVGSSTGQEDKEALEEVGGTEEEKVGRYIQEDKVPSVLESMSWPDLTV